MVALQLVEQDSSSGTLWHLTMNLTHLCRLYNATAQDKAHGWKQEFRFKVKTYSFGTLIREMTIGYVK